MGECEVGLLNVMTVLPRSGPQISNKKQTFKDGRTNGFSEVCDDRKDAHSMQLEQTRGEQLSLREEGMRVCWGTQVQG